MTFPNGQTTYFQNGTSQDLFNVSQNGIEGLYDPPLCFYEVAPVAPSATFIANAQTIPAVNANVTLNFNTFSNGFSSVQLDCPRMVLITLASASTADIEIKISGYDRSNVSISTIVTVLSGNFTAPSLIGFYGINSATILTNPDAYTGNISIGTNNQITLPYFSCINLNHVINLTFNGGTFSANAYFTPASNWRTTPPSNETSDCKGIITIPSTPTGSQVLSILYYVYGADFQLNRDLLAGVQSAFTLIGAPNPASTYPNGRYPSPYPANTPPPNLVAADATGLQYPGQLDEYTALMNIGAIA